MKTYRISLLIPAIFSVAFFSASCNANIDLEPEGKIASSSFFRNANDYELALNSAYNRLNYSSLGFWFDGCSDDAIVTHSWNRGYDLGRGNGNSSSSFPSNKWNYGYVSYQMALNVVNNIDTYAWPGGETDATRLRVLGEARTLSSYFLLDLLCTFGRIVFYDERFQSVEESYSARQLQTTEDIKEVFDFILEKLYEVIPGLPDAPANKSKVGKAAARLLRARTAAYAAGYLEDKSYFDITLSETEALLDMNHSLAGDFAALFTMGGEELDEVILVKSYSSDSRNSWGNWYNNSIGGYCVTTPVKALVDAYEYIGPVNPDLPYENKEPRFYETIYAPGAVLRGKYYNTIPNNTITDASGRVIFDPAKDYGGYTQYEVMVGDVLGDGTSGEWNKTLSGFTFKKYNTESSTWTTWNPYIVFRFAEAYLLRAEALVERNGSGAADEDEAKELLRTVRDRAGNTNDIDEVLASTYGNDLLALIRNERRVEFAHEGFRLFDLRRWKILLDVMNRPVEGITYNDYSSGSPVRTTYSVAERVPFTQKDYWWPIPQAELDLNEGRLTQNSDW